MTIIYINLWLGLLCLMPLSTIHGISAIYM